MVCSLLGEPGTTIIAPETVGVSPPNELVCLKTPLPVMEATTVQLTPVPATLIAVRLVLPGAHGGEKALPQLSTWAVSSAEVNSRAMPAISKGLLMTRIEDGYRINAKDLCLLCKKIKEN